MCAGACLVNKWSCGTRLRLIHVYYKHDVVRSSTTHTYKCNKVYRSRVNCDKRFFILIYWMFWLCFSIFCIFPVTLCIYIYILSFVFVLILFKIISVKEENKKLMMMIYHEYNKRRILFILSVLFSFHVPKKYWAIVTLLYLSLYAFNFCVF